MEFLIWVKIALRNKFSNDPYMSQNYPHVITNILLTYSYSGHIFNSCNALRLLI